MNPQPHVVGPSLERRHPVSPRVWWWLMVAGFGGVLLCFATWPQVFRFGGVNHLGAWFIDLYAILASCDALAAGLDPYQPNPLDVFGRPHAYAHWWLGLGRLGFTRADTPMLGFLLGAAFFVAAVFALRPSRRAEWAGALAVLCSPPILLALERANNDLVIFVLLAPVVPCFLSPRVAVRLCAVPLILAAAALKVYPLVALVLLLAGRDAHDTRRLGWVAVLLLAVALPDMVNDFRGYAGLVPDAVGLTTFGARNLFAAAGVTGGAARLAALAAGGLIFAGLVWSNRLAAWKIAPGDRAAWLSFVLGALLLTGCFFAGTSYAYRWVFALWLVPLLWRLPRDPAVPREVRRWAVATVVLLVIALWTDSTASAVMGWFSRDRAPEKIMAAADRFFLIEQPVTWALFVCLLGFLAHFLREGVRGLFSANREATPPAR